MRTTIAHSLAASTIALALTTEIAAAHTGLGDTASFVSGFGHPLFGLDHALAMIAVGLFAALLGGRALWAVPAAFVAVMLLGGVLGMLQVGIPAVEAGIAASVVVLGVVVALGRQWPVAVAMALVGSFAVFHGHAHGAEMDIAHGAALYSLGFALATALLHGLGVLLGAAAFGRRAIIRVAGSGVALAGLVLALV